jgi:thiol-disulfide isomerase/thioredoxin
MTALARAREHTDVAKRLREGQFAWMKIPLLLPLLAAALLAAPHSHAGFFDEIKSDLSGPAVEGSPKFTALYFSAQWCPPCRMFTPKLVEWYNNFKAKHPEFELVFVSSDRDQAAMEKYIKDDKMPWPAVKFDLAQSEKFQKFSSSGIPYLVLIDNEGKAVTAKPDNEWQAPTQVLTEIEKIVDSGN